jgi:hypothetical protein
MALLVLRTPRGSTEPWLYSLQPYAYTFRAAPAAAGGANKQQLTLPGWCCAVGRSDFTALRSLQDGLNLDSHTYWRQCVRSLCQENSSASGTAGVNLAV